ncbi:CTD phosphatase Fcp1 [Knufia fluminis]|uniref:RNA polymerase II subunit A C-terminal domain phosphatase n=1 Tax=Knufia fluminis TaxID=191047 RepID=A0AAN8ISA2_9EURO|nr:CTD phosphatase Fcp1 [Knufia fluminis]
MRLRLPATLHYPIIIRKIEKQVDDEIKHRDTLFTYTYIGKVKHQDRYSDEEVEVDKVFPAHFQSTLEGTIESWLVWEGDEIRAPRDILEVNEPCKHSVQFNGMCVECGRDMTEYAIPDEASEGVANIESRVEYAGDEYTERANIQGAHDTDKLLISQDEASEVDQLSKRHLLNGRKLSLVVDLDQTIIHAAVDPTIGEWQKDPENPNYDALKDVRAFQLKDEGPGARACWYYIKLRPGLEQFLENVSEKYELHIYTMGTRQYAKEIAKIVDPDRKYFEDRILSRDESGSMVAKNLTRLFPVDTRMVVIIDDRADVWRWSPNLLRVSAFDFFIGIGDINAGFLPKRQEIQSTKKIEAPNEDKSTDTNGHAAAQTGETEQAVNGDGPDDATPAQTDTTALQQVVAMTRPDADATIQEQQLQTQDEVIASQLEDKPLLRLQQKMDEKDGVANDATPNASEGPTSTQQTDSDSSDSETSSGGARAKRHSILRNDDEELIHLERSLRTLHERFYAEYDRKRNSGAGKGARVAALAGKQKPPIPDTQSSSDAHNVPDVKKIMPALKQRILAGVVIVFSGVLPLNTDIQNADVSIWAKSFGATISDKVNKETTHVIAARVGTAKVKTAVKRGIKVVGTDWLMQSIQQWRKLDERPYMLKGIGQKELLSNIKEDPSSEVEVPESDAVDASMIAVMGDADLKLSSEEDTSAVNDTDDSEDDGPKKKRPKLNLEETPVFDPDAEPQIVSPESPVELHADEWADMDDELKEFMGSDLDSESDAESVRSDRSLTTRTKKRSRDDDTDGESGTDGEGRNGETEHKRPKRTSALRAVKNAGSSAGSTPKDPGQEVPTTLGRAQTQDEYDAELALELEQQMEAAAEEEENS